MKFVRPIEMRNPLKWFTLSGLVFANLISLVLSVEFGLQEFQLPDHIRLDELRLLEPQNFRETFHVLHDFGLQTDEIRLEKLNRCVRDISTSKGAQCDSILNHILNRNPVNGRLWLEVARLQSQETGTLGLSAIKALEHSYEYAPREGWVVAVRAKFVLSVWLALPPNLKQLATDEMIEGFSDLTFVNFLAGIYRYNPGSRRALREILLQAPLEKQRLFLSVINS